MMKRRLSALTLAGMLAAPETAATKKDDLSLILTRSQAADSD
jgi:hypothetical protein